ncbi:MAG: hypothetical protein R2705_14885 [Ilumatobacteraceae bacterium]
MTASTILWFLVAVVMFLVIWKVGMAMTRSLTTMPPEPPPTGEMRRVSKRYRCSICGVELRLTMAPDEDPPPPRHCMEEMDLLPPRYE